MLYTTYFAKLKSLPKGIIPISICGKAPEWYQGLEYKKFAPKWDFFNKWKQNQDNNYYIQCFKEQVLANLDAEKVYKELVTLAESSDIALVCYERPDKFCHRHLVADWLMKNGIQIEEFVF